MTPIEREILRQWKRAGGDYKLAAEAVEQDLKEEEAKKEK